MRCSACQHENREEAKFCEACGQQLALACPACGKPARTGAAFCDTCGAALKAKATGNGQQEKKTHPRPPIPDPQNEAEECFLKAIEVSRKQQAKSLELRAAVSLARLWQQQGKQHEARDTLAAVYPWFTEGFDTKDLQEAKVLLDELDRANG